MSVEHPSPSPSRFVPLPTAPGIPVLFGFLTLGVIALELTASAFTRQGLRAAPEACIAIMGAAAVPAWLSRKRPAGDERQIPPPLEDALLVRLSRAASAAGFPEGGEVLDARLIYPEFLFHAEAARMLVFPTGESFLVARFKNSDAALEAAHGYKQFFGMEDSILREQSNHRWVWKGRRRQTSDFAYLKREDDTLSVWTARDLSRLERPMLQEPGSSLG